MVSKKFSGSHVVVAGAAEVFIGAIIVDDIREQSSSNDVESMEVTARVARNPRMRRIRVETEARNPRMKRTILWTKSSNEANNPVDEILECEQFLRSSEILECEQFTFA